MSYEDYPTSPYSEREQQRIMEDLEYSKQRALEEGDELKLSYLNDIEVCN